MRKTTVAVATAATAIVAAGAGLGTASASQGAPAAARTGTEHVYLMSTSPSSNKSAIIVTGLFTASGYDVGANAFDTVHLPGGTFRVNHPDNGNQGKSTVNKTTCFATYTGTTKVTLSGGTGKYKGISGSGKATLSVVGILARVKGKCSFSANSVAQQETITGTIKVHL